MNVYYLIGAVLIVVVIGLVIYLLTHRSVKEPRVHTSIVTFDDGYYHDLSSDERFVKMAEFEKHGNEFIAQSSLNEVRLKREIGKVLEMDLAKIHVIVKRW